MNDRSVTVRIVLGGLCAFVAALPLTAHAQTTDTGDGGGNNNDRSTGASYALAAATGGAAVFSGVRNFNGGLYLDRPDGASAYGGTVMLSGTLQFSDFNQLGPSPFEFNADSGGSGTLRYTGRSTTTTNTLSPTTRATSRPRGRGGT